MKYDFLILSSEKKEDVALQLCKSLSDKGAKCITNADPKQRPKSLFEAVSNSEKVLVLVSSEVDIEEDEQFLELLDGAYVDGAEINAVFEGETKIPEELILYLGRREALDYNEACLLELPIKLEQNHNLDINGTIIGSEDDNSNVIGKNNNQFLEEKLNNINTTNEATNQMADNGYELFTQGTSYITGNGALMDKKRGLNLWMEAANAGYIPAYYEIGKSFYYFTNGANELIEYKSDSIKEGTEWLRKAAELDSENSVSAMHLLGLSFIKLKDRNQAEYWLKIAYDNAEGDLKEEIRTPLAKLNHSYLTNAEKVVIGAGHAFSFFTSGKKFDWDNLD